ncbi:hypothetical protein BD779DRAFT_816439 [Infundibulicybe gibba]|nr:hypothetical protein BD779DRAFT_816439 [Infundibulicybe gibba]
MHSRGGHPQLLKLYLKYSARTALSIGFELPQHPDAPSLPLITPYLPRSQCLKVAYFNDVPDLEPFIAHMHFPLLRSLELFCQYPIDDITQALQGQSTSVRLEDIQFPWNQLTQLTIPFRNTTETLTLLRHCSSLEMLRLRTSWYTWSETPHTPPEPNVVHRHLRTIAFEDGSLTGLFMGLLGCLITPALSTLEFIRSRSSTRLDTI